MSELASARRTQGVVPAGTLEKLDTFARAYQLQHGVRIELGAQIVGWKVAAPPGSEVMAAPLFDFDRIPTDAILYGAALFRDGVECELALRIDRPLPVGGCTHADAMAAVGAVMPAFELLCSRLPGKFSSSREHLVADGLGHGAVVLGDPFDDWRSLDFDAVRVTLWADEVCVVDKHGGNPFGDPLIAVVLLTNHLALHDQRLMPGDFVLAGSHTGVYRVQPGQRLRCVFSGIGQIALDAREAGADAFKETDHAGR